MAQLVTLGETMAACSVLHPPARPSSVRSPRTSRKGFLVDFNCNLHFRPWLRVILPEQSASMPFCFVCCVNHFHS